jgi:hypothetical protein
LHHVRQNIFLLGERCATYGYLTLSYACQTRSSMTYEIDTSFVQYVIHDNGILEAKYKSDVLTTITKDIAEEIVGERLVFQSGNTFSLLLIWPSGVRMSREAIQVFASPTGTAGINALAVLFDNEDTYSSIKLFTSFQRKPVYVFRNREQAREWLLSFKKYATQASAYTQMIRQMFGFASPHPETAGPLDLTRRYINRLLNRHAVDRECPQHHRGCQQRDLPAPGLPEGTIDW